MITIETVWRFSIWPLFLRFNQEFPCCERQLIAAVKPVLQPQQVLHVRFDRKPGDQPGNRLQVIDHGAYVGESQPARPFIGIENGQARRSQLSHVPFKGGSGPLGFHVKRCQQVIGP